MLEINNLKSLTNQPQKVLDFLDNDLLDIKDFKHAKVCIDSIFAGVMENLENGFWLSFAIRLKSKELLYFYDSEKILYFFKDLFNLIDNYDKSVYVCKDYDNYFIYQNLLSDSDFPHVPKQGELLELLNSIYNKNNISKNDVIEDKLLTDSRSVDRKAKFINHYYGDISKIKPTEFYQRLRNQRDEPYITLRKDNIVKSKAEKWIADFLFEHGIDYIYEKEYDLTCLSGIDDQFLYDFGRKTTKPDFFLTEYNLVWEHWGIDENEKNEKNKESFSKYVSSWEKYRNDMDLKRFLWNDIKEKLLFYKLEYGSNESIESINSVNGLIETSEANLKKERYYFEQNVKKILETNGVIVKKRSEKELIDQVWNSFESSL